MSSDRLMATSYRFETNKGYSNTRRLAQEAKIEAYEDDMRKIAEQQKINQSAFKTTWNAKFETTNENHAINYRKKQFEDELRVIRKATVLVRRDALKELFLKEFQIYESELNLKGLCMHKERL